MARPPRLEVSGALYHVTARGNERRAIFHDDTDREEYLARIAQCREKSRFQLLAYCLMTNHVHLVIRTGPEPLSRIMARLHSIYAGWFNRRHNRVGHLFQGRYKAFLVQKDRYLHSLIRYVHRNPVQARVARSASDYAWSSDRFLRRGKGPDWLDVDPLLALLDESRRAAVRRYVELVDGSANVPDYGTCEAIDRTVIGDELFAAAQFQSTAGSEPNPTVRGIGLDSILATVARDCGLTVEQLEGRQRGGEFAAARCRAAYLARHVCRIPLSRLAIRLHRDDSSFARPLASLESRLETDQALRRRIQSLIQSLQTPTPKSEKQV
jgi:REP element-mobilizing transposase RayT